MSRGEQLLASTSTGLLFSGYVAVVCGSVDLACSDWLTVAARVMQFVTITSVLNLKHMYIMHVHVQV